MHEKNVFLAYITNVFMNKIIWGTCHVNQKILRKEFVSACIHTIPLLISNSEMMQLAVQNQI